MQKRNQKCGLATGERGLRFTSTKKLGPQAGDLPGAKT
jgi:hypothetical protein